MTMAWMLKTKVIMMTADESIFESVYFLIALYRTLTSYQCLIVIVNWMFFQPWSPIVANSVNVFLHAGIICFFDSMLRNH